MRKKGVVRSNSDKVNRVIVEDRMVVTWQKTLALLLLAWVFLDVAVPGVCPLDKNALGLSDGVSMQAVLANAPNSADNAVANDDGCFCSCSHLIARVHFVLDFSIRSFAVEAQPSFVALEGPPASLYHPPRS